MLKRTETHLEAQQFIFMLFCLFMFQFFGHETCNKSHRMFSSFSWVPAWFSSPLQKTTSPHAARREINGLLEHVNWETSVVGGSFALHRFTVPATTMSFADHFRGRVWTPDDIDVMVGCVTEDEFMAEAARFEQVSQCVRIKDSSQALLVDVDRRSEKFHERIVRSLTYDCNARGTSGTCCTSTVPQSQSIPKVQLVGIKVDKDQKCGPIPELLNVLNDITDLPAAVSFTLSNKTMFFHVPEKAALSLLTKTVNVKDICPERKAKYATRGYTFTNVL